MHDILLDLVIHASPSRVFRAFAEPEGLDAWWTLSSSGRPEVGEEYRFFFGPEYDWKGRVRRLRPDHLIEWEITKADRDWTGTIVGAELENLGSATRLRFRHTGWAEVNDHFRQSSYCWALYLRILRRWIEDGIEVPYADRYDS